MRKLFSIIAALSISAIGWTQSPQKISYQAVIRNANNNLVINQSIGMRVSILQGSASGTEIFKEIYNPNPVTNANGLVTIEIGSGLPFLGAFSSINWANGPYFIKTETDPTGGTNYNIVGTSELLSVPYALFSANGTPGPQGPQGPIGATGGYPVHTIGENYGGGIVFYVYDNGQHGLIAATTDQSTDTEWYYYSNGAIVALRDGIHAGQYNTERIIVLQGAGNYAAQICANYNGGSNGDWYLPSKFELNLLYSKIDLIGGFSKALYWSSTEINTGGAWQQSFTNGQQDHGYGKVGNICVRAVRSF